METKQKVFKMMEEMGWNLDDFDEVCKIHLKFFEQTMKKHEEEGLENELTHASQFFTDFFKSLEEVEKRVQGVVPKKHILDQNKPKKCICPSCKIDETDGSFTVVDSHIYKVDFRDNEGRWVIGRVQDGYDRLIDGGNIYCNNCDSTFNEFEIVNKDGDANE